jgi:hypothetical protein
MNMGHDWSFLVIVVFVVLTISIIVKGEIGKQAYHRRGEKMLERLKHLDGILCINTHEDVIAVCTREDFENGIAEHNRKIAKGELKEWEKVLSYARPTFTFAKNRTVLRSTHTGMSEDIEKILEEIIKIVTGFGKDDVPNDSFEEAVKIIAHKDESLFVPYSGSVLNPQNQLERYGKTTLEEVREKLNLNKKEC